MWNANQAANLFKVQRETIRQYCLEFTSHLSPQANPGKNRTRAFTEDDMEVFALVVEMKAQGKLYSDIHAALANGTRGQLPPEFDAIIASEGNRYKQMELKLVFANEENEKLRDQQKEDRGQIKLLKEQLTEWQAKYERAIRENALLRAGVKVID